MKTTNLWSCRFRVACVLSLLGNFSLCHAGVFNLPHLVTPGEFAAGVEPELNVTGVASLGLNLRYTHGLTELNNVVGIVGIGGGTRGLRFGGAVTFDFFPDVGDQPGIGLAIQGLFVQLPTVGSVEVTATPYVHKTFKIEQGNQAEPFFAVPIGLSLAQGMYTTLVSVSVGGIFQHTDHLRSVFEVGIGLNNTNTYISGGLTYYH